MAPSRSGWRLVAPAATARPNVSAQPLRERRSAPFTRVRSTERAHERDIGRAMRTLQWVWPRGRPDWPHMPPAQAAHQPGHVPLRRQLSMGCGRTTQVDAAQVPASAMRQEHATAPCTPSRRASTAGACAKAGAGRERRLFGPRIRVLRPSCAARCRCGRLPKLGTEASAKRHRSCPSCPHVSRSRNRADEDLAGPGGGCGS